MNYFCDVHVQSRRDQERRLFVILEVPPNESEQPHLTKEILLQNIQYRDFVQTYKPKLVMVDYVVYATETEVYAGLSDDAFVALIEDSTTERIAQSELQMDTIRDKAAGGKKHRKLTPPMLLGLIGGVLVLAIAALGFGMKLGQNRVTVQEEIAVVEPVNEDGMLIPEQAAVESNSEQITVTIDRSYAAIPTEDLQIKGAVIKGKAEITLPEFDRTDFFTHVPGYTWGFSTVPDADRIEYYGGQTYSFSQDTKLYRVLVKYGGGSGTKDDPYNAAGRELPQCYGGSIQGCTARRITLRSEYAGGGIAGEASTGAVGAMIANCCANDLNLNVGDYEDDERTKVKSAGIAGGIIGMDGNEKNGHFITGCVSPVEYPVFGQARISNYDDTVRLAPDYAFYQENILSVINRNTVLPDAPGEIFTGAFKFGDAAIYGDENGALPYPESVEDLIMITNEEVSSDE